MTERREGSWFSGFFAILYYEFLWNLRKKKTISLFLIIFAILTLELVLPPILAYAAGQEFQKSSTFVIDSATVLPNIFIFLLGVATTMNTISGEFESGSIVPLLTKPVSKNLVFLGKIVAASLTLLAAYTFLGSVRDHRGPRRSRNPREPASPTARSRRPDRRDYGLGFNLGRSGNPFQKLPRGCFGDFRSLYRPICHWSFTCLLPWPDVDSVLHPRRRTLRQYRSLPAGRRLWRKQPFHRHQRPWSPLGAMGP